ncbi:hypothetical protein ACSBR1_023970 [Camellia fascicularis]
MDVNSTLSACLICRKVSYFVIPSVIWYSTKEEKQEIVDSYKAKLRYFWSRSLLLVDFMPVKNVTNFCFCTIENVEENF